MKKPETIFKEKVLRDLRAAGAWAEKIQQVGIRGTPDILACLNGRFIALELKKDKEARIDKLQVVKLRKISKLGGISFLVSPETWQEILEKIIRLTSEPF